MKEKLSEVRNHVYKHRAKYTLVLCTTVYGTLVWTRAVQWNAFLELKGIDPTEFYNTL